MILQCSITSREMGEPLAGSAPFSRCWIIIEQAGPWGREALLDSHLDHNLGLELTELTQRFGVKILLARHVDRPERIGERSKPTDRNVWVAHTAPGATRMRHGVLSDMTEVARWDFAALAEGGLPAFGEARSKPLMFICTHSGRDACCAIHGRELMAQTMLGLNSMERAAWWECSHIGGHRFAPTALSLPSGTVFGRLSKQDALRIATDAKECILQTSHYRGRTAFPAPYQVAEIAVREATGVVERDSLDVLRIVGGRAVPVGASTETGTSIEIEVRHHDGRRWRVNVRRTELASARPESCGASPVDAHIWRAEAVSEVTPWRTSRQ